MDRAFRLIPVKTRTLAVRAAKSDYRFREFKQPCHPKIPPYIKNKVFYPQEIYTALAAPLLKHLPGSQMIAIDVAAPFFIPFKLTLMLCVFLAVPYLLYQIWSFIAPGLYTHEKRLVVPMLVSSTGLFYLGVAFAYFVVFPLVFGFFTSVAPEGVTVSTDIGRYLDFVITLFFAFGIAFEVPVATVLVVAVGITTPENLVKNGQRIRYFFREQSQECCVNFN